MKILTTNAAKKLRSCFARTKMENNTYNTYINVLNIRGDCTVLGDLITDNGKKINNVFLKQQ